jgi:hypothetical protein
MGMSLLTHVEIFEVLLQSILITLSSKTKRKEKTNGQENGQKEIVYLDPESPYSLADDEVYIPHYDEGTWEDGNDEDGE